MTKPGARRVCSAPKSRSAFHAVWAETWITTSLRMDDMIVSATLAGLWAWWSRRLRLCGHRAHRFACAVQPRHYGSDRHVEHVGDLGVEQSFEDDQGEHFPLLGRKPRKPRQHLVGISPIEQRGRRRSSRASATWRSAPSSGGGLRGSRANRSRCRRCMTANSQWRSCGHGAGGDRLPDARLRVSSTSSSARRRSAVSTRA